MSDALYVSELTDMLTDWFETIEEVEMTDDDRVMLEKTAMMLSSAKVSALAMGVEEEHFDDWLQADVLEQWSYLLDDEEEQRQENPIATFADFVMNGEQRLYLQMLKRCMSAAEQATA